MAGTTGPGWTVHGRAAIPVTTRGGRAGGTLETLKIRPEVVGGSSYAEASLERFWLRW